MTSRSRLLTSPFLATVVTYLAVGSLAYSQTYYQEQEVRVNHLPTVVARSHNPSDVLLASLETVFHDLKVCCNRDSALGDSAQAADPRSLKEIAAKLEGRHLLGDGRPIHVTTEYVTPEAFTASRVVSALIEQRLLLMLWNWHLYVVYGADYLRTEDVVSGGTAPVIRKFLLWDTRYSDERRSIVFDRETEDPTSVQGFLFLQSHME